MRDIASRPTQECSRAPRILASRRARLALQKMSQDRGRMVILLTGACHAPSVASVRAESGFMPDEHQAIIGHVVHCPVYADVREIQLCPHDAIVIDIGWVPAHSHADPLLVTRIESKPEREERLMAEQLHYVSSALTG
jgi:uncharacterized protein (DUF779 family)